MARLAFTVIRSLIFSFSLDLSHLQQGKEQNKTLRCLGRHFSSLERTLVAFLEIGFLVDEKLLKCVALPFFYTHKLFIRLGQG